MFQTRIRTGLTLLFFTLILAISFLIGPPLQANASSAPDFALSASPASQTIPRAQDALYNIHVQALNGFTGSVSFTFTGRPNHGSGTFFPSSVTGSGDTTFNARAGEDSPPGTFSLTVIGTSGTLQHTVQVTLIISATAPDFSLSVNPIAQTVHRGGTARYDLHIQDLNGFNGTVTLAIDHGPGPDSFFFTSSSVTGSGDTTFVVQTSSQSVLGTFTVTLIADSGGLEHRIQVNYTVVA